MFICLTAGGFLPEITAKCVRCRGRDQNWRDSIHPAAQPHYSGQEEINWLKFPCLLKLANFPQKRATRLAKSFCFSCRHARIPISPWRSTALQSRFTSALQARSPRCRTSSCAWQSVGIVTARRVTISALVLLNTPLLEAFYEPWQAQCFMLENVKDRAIVSSIVRTLRIDSRSPTRPPD